MFRFRQVQGIFLFCKFFTSVMEPSKPLIERFPMDPPPEIWRQEREPDYPFLSNAKVKNVWSYTSTPIRLHGVHRVNFAFQI